MLGSLYTLVGTGDYFKFCSSLYNNMGSKELRRLSPVE